MGEERREFQRLAVDPPLPATLAGRTVALSEIGVLGARVEHSEPIAVEYADLHFIHDSKRVTLRCEVVRTIRAAARAGRGMQSAVRFLAAVGESGDLLRALLAKLVNEAFRSRRQPPADTFEPHRVDGDRTVRGRDAAFLSYRLDGGVWKCRRVFLPEQPASGFTVARSEDSEEMQRLCQVYQASDEEGRRLIRLFAELSVSEALEIPPTM